KLVPYHELVRICLDAGDERLIEALMIVESARSRTLVDSLGGTHENLIEPRDAFEASLLAQIGGLREELNYLYKEINQPVNGDGNRKLSQLQAELQEREKKVLEVTRQLHHRRESEVAPLQSFDVRQLQRQIGENDALVEYTSLGDELLAFVVTSGRVHVVRNIASVAEIDTSLRALRFQIDSLRFGAQSIRRHLSKLTEKINVHLQRLYDQLIRPLEQTVEERKLIVVPQGGLHYLPFQALHDGDQYLIERCEISFTPSAAIFQQCLQRGEHKLSRALLMGVADEQAPRIVDEIRTLTNVFPDATALVENEATIAALRQHSDRVDLLHLACHGQFRSDNPLFSAL